jgi:hypothetical protein
MREGPRMNAADVVYWARNHKASTAGLVLVVAGCIALVGLSRRAHHLHPKVAAVASVAASDAATAAASGGGNGLTPSGQQGTEQNARSTKMRSEFENATDYLAFIGQAMSRPQEGGKFYALLAWKRCNDLTRHKGAAAERTGNDAFHDGAAALVEDIAKRCAGVLETYPSIQGLYDVVMEQRGGKDFLMPVNGRGIIAPTGRATANSDIDTALKTGDRWAAAEALENNADFVEVGNSAGDDGVDRQLHEWGAELVACELVGNCRGGVQASLHCVGTGDCVHEDYRDVIRAQVPDTHKLVFETLVEGLRQRVGLAGKPDEASN